MGSKVGEECRSDFPIFEHWRKQHPLARNGRLVYLDSAATAQKPQQVIQAVTAVYSECYANVHRSVYELGDRTTQLFEASRAKVATFLNARHVEEVIFTSGCTDSINLVAHSWARSNLKAGDEIITTVLEHHANFVPWQEVARVCEAKVHYLGLTPSAEFDLGAYEAALSDRTKLVAVSQLSNALGVELPIAEICQLAHKYGALVLVDAAQSVAHGSVDVQALGADFLTFSGHKLYGPNGVGVLWGRKEILEQMPPFRLGGSMINTVAIEGTTFAGLPNRFEAGTPNISGVIGLGAAIDYLSSIGFEAICVHEAQLLSLMEAQLSAIPQVRLLGPMGRRHALLSFVVEEVHPHDLAQILDQQGVAIRAGHHCAQPLLRQLGLTATTRASLGIYNTADDVDALTQGIRDAIAFFSPH